MDGRMMSGANGKVSREGEERHMWRNRSMYLPRIFWRRGERTRDDEVIRGSEARGG